MCGGDGEGGDSCGFGAEDSGAEGDVGPVVLGEERHFFWGPAAFGTDGEGEIGGVLGWWSVYIPPIAVRLRWMGHPASCRLQVGRREGGGEGEGLLGFAEEDARGRGLAGEGGGEWGGREDFGDVGAAGLLGAFERDATPAFGALGSGEGEVLLGAAGEDGSDARDAEFGGFFDGPLEAIELEDGEQKVDGEGCVCL